MRPFTRRSCTGVGGRAAKLFALAAETHHSRQRLESLQQSITDERDHWQALIEVNYAVVGTLDPEAIRVAAASSMRRFIAFKHISLLLLDADGERFGLISLDPVVPAEVSEAVASIRVENTPLAETKQLRKPILLEPRQMTFLPDLVHQIPELRSMSLFCLLPLETPRRLLGALGLSSQSADSFRPDEVERAAQAARQIAIAIENALTFQEVTALKDRITEEKLYLEDEIRGWNELEEIVGESDAISRVLAQVRSVADTQTTVLLLGETGTGKELLARAIHSLSARRPRTLVAINCAASPESLLESEWFGYEKGAFTGALARKKGRFELADKGTLFLDEVADIPLHLQAKLLRVLENHEIERVGATRPVAVDLRLIAATNADLQSLVDDKPLHSIGMAPALQAVKAAFGASTPRPWKIAMISSVFTKVISTTDELVSDIERNMIGSVHWWQTFKWMAEDLGVDRFVNIGPISTLIRFAERIPLDAQVEIDDLTAAITSRSIN